MITPMKQKIEGGWEERFRSQRIFEDACQGLDRKYVEDFIETLLQRKERETIKRVMDVMPKKEIELPQEMLERMGLTQGRYAIEAYNHAIGQMTDNINKLK